jgi:uncharacterized protein YdeI (YjbR/CyaY-like superfamily)
MALQARKKLRRGRSARRRSNGGGGVIQKSAKSLEVRKKVEGAKQWRDELLALRELLLDEGLTEELKWSKAAFTLEGANVAVLMGTKDSVRLMFFKGVLLKDPQRILSAMGPNSRSGRWAKFQSVGEIEKHADAVKDCIREAIELERAGVHVDKQAFDTLKAPPELKKKLASDAAFKKAFTALTPGRQRAYTIHFAGAKQAATRESRIAKHEKRILAGKGMMDR